MDTSYSASSNKATLFLRMLLNKYFSGKADLLNKLMPQELQDRLQGVSSLTKDPSLVLFNAQEWLHMCDPSWYESTIAALPEAQNALYSGLIQSSIAQTDHTPAVSQFLMKYLHTQWHKKLHEDEPLPKEFIETSDLGPLLEMKKQDILDIVDLLSMNNLVDEVRHVVDKRILQLLSQVLTNSQQQYLRMCLRQKSKCHTPIVSLRELLKEPKKLPSILHRQGLKRLAIALKGQNKDFIWYILHQLDITRAKFVQSDIEEQQTAHITKLAQLEILQIIQFLKTGKTP